MSRIHQYESKDCTPRHFQDICRLREKIPELGKFLSSQIELMYSDFCDENYSAGWLYLQDYVIEEFKNWLLS